MAAPRVPLYRQAQEQLKTYIGAHKLRPGDALPPEGALAEELGMSRLSLREATKSLESLGILEARHGEGVYVKAFSFDPILNNLPYSLFGDGKALRDLFQVRRGLEEGLIEQLFGRVSERDLDALDAIVVEMEACARRGQPIVEPDREFHLQLFRPLGNTLVLRLIETFWEVYHRLRREMHVGLSDPRRVHGIHAGIVAALRTGDRERIREAMVNHFAVMPLGLEDE
jgi:DNA-binding FadR family transcriptional regulator